VSFNGSYDRALASEFANVFDSSSFFGSNSDSGDTTTDGLANLPFGRANTWRASVAFSQNLYSGGRLRLEQQIARIGRDNAGFGLTTTRAQALLELTQAYYDAALSDRLVAIAQATLDQATATLDQTQAAFRAGTQPEFEVLRARVNRDNQTPVLIRQRMNKEIAVLRLKQLLDLSPTYDLRLAESLADDRLAPPPAFASRVAAAEASIGPDVAAASIPSTVPVPARVVVTEAETSLRLRETTLQLTIAQRMPNVFLNSTLSRVGYPSGVFPVLDRTNWTIGASVDLPLLTGGRQRGDELVAKADVDQSRAQLQQTQELADLETRSAWAELTAARVAWEATAGTVQQANRAYQIAEVRYQSGVSTQLELADSRLLLQQAEANRALAARDLQVARARIALLPDLPLGSASPVAATRVLQQNAPQPQTPAFRQQTPNAGQLVNTGSAPLLTNGTR